MDQKETALEGHRLVPGAIGVSVGEAPREAESEGEGARACRLHGVGTEGTEIASAGFHEPGAQ